mgnify:CR=1 FL=1
MKYASVHVFENLQEHNNEQMHRAWHLNKPLTCPQYAFGLLGACTGLWVLVFWRKQVT